MKDFGSRLDKGLAEEIAQITRAESKPRSAAASVHLEAATGGIVINGAGNTITVSAALPQNVLGASQAVAAPAAPVSACSIPAPPPVRTWTPDIRRPPLPYEAPQTSKPLAPIPNPNSTPAAHAPFVSVRVKLFTAFWSLIAAFLLVATAKGRMPAGLDVWERMIFPFQAELPFTAWVWIIGAPVLPAAVFTWYIGRSLRD